MILKGLFRVPFSEESREAENLICISVYGPVARLVGVVSLEQRFEISDMSFFLFENVLNQVPASFKTHIGPFITFQRRAANSGELRQYLHTTKA